MKLPISWLKEYVSFDITPEELADKITMTGLEVESVDSAVNFEGVVIGEVLEREKHPNADKLNVAKVNVGKEILQIVCGAPNLNVGQKVAVALVGAKLGDFEIGKVELRGIESSGMICSEKELSLGEDHNGIMVLDKKAKVGEDFAKFIKAEKVLDIKVFANRPDMMGIEGLAREVAATLNKKFDSPKIKLNENKEEINKLVNIRVESKKICPRYVARVVRNVVVTDSPAWLQERLIACGIRPINNIVDISNYVMLQTGQPLHFFDLDKLGSDPEVIVRTANKGEMITTLDGAVRKLTEEMLLIATPDKAIGIAGVMGGENTEVDTNTKNILIEAAVFEKSNIRKTSRLLGLRTEAVARFEKGIPFELPEVAIDRAADLLVDLALGIVVSGKVDVKNAEPKPVELEVSPEKISKFLGIKVEVRDFVKILELLGFETTGREKLKITVPWWRTDIQNETDIAEEIIRIWGYDKLPSTLPTTGSVVPKQNKSFMLSSQIRELLSSIGLTEILTYSFIGGKELKAVGENLDNAPKLENPLVAEQEYMRTSLVPHLLNAIRENQFNRESVKFFEIAKTFKLDGKNILPIETKQLVVGITGGEVWPIHQKNGKNFYNLKGILARLMADLKVPYEVVRSESNSFKVNVSADIVVNGKVVGNLGEIKKEILDKFDLKKEVGVLTLNLDAIEVLANKTVIFEEFSKYPKVTRDLSVIMKDSAEVSEFLSSLPKVSSLIHKIEIVDIYQGKPLAAEEKSITFRLEIWSNEKTLVDQEVDQTINLVEKQVAKLGGEIRGGKKL